MFTVTVDGAVNASADAQTITNGDRITAIVSGHQASSGDIIAVVTALYKRRTGGRDIGNGTAIAHKVLISILFLGNTGLKSGCFPTGMGARAGTGGSGHGEGSRGRGCYGRGYTVV